jgi:CRISPR/Cas system-associated exonuclease Cas4 (RecB family)
MGSAFHQTLAFLTTRWDANIVDALRLFDDVLKSERAEASRNFREKALPWSRELREVMENTIAIIVASGRTGRPMRLRRAIETTLTSADGLLVGRPDEVIIAESDTIIVDFKTGQFREEDLSEFEDQIHFYAGLWEEVHGGLPRLGRVEFLLSGKRHEFEIDESRSRSLLLSARDAASKIRNRGWEPLANPGTQCSFCPYRPWCDEYWRQDRSAQEGPPRDLQGVVCAVHRGDSRALCIEHCGDHRTITNKSREPLSEVSSGKRIRAIDLASDGTVWFRTDWSEIFVVEE